MAKSGNSFQKKQLADQNRKRQKEKFEKKLEKKNKPTENWEDMIMYVDENGNFTKTPPAPKPVESE
ncbi:MAG: cold-shock protein [Bacteroidetes bacterium]|nr:cold-shock protein [Bacteroidota bacterium]